MIRRLVLSGATAVGLLVASTAPAPAAPADAEAVFTGVTQVTVDQEHSCARLANGQARCWGSSFDGEIGDGADVPRDHPVVVKNPAGTGPLTGVVQIDAGVYNTCAVLSNGQARCWGFNGDGQAGDGTTVDYRFLARVVKNPAGTGPLTQVLRISAGERHTCALLTTGQVRCWGENVSGELGTGATGPPEPLAQVVLNRNGTGPLRGVTQIDAGNSRTCVRLGNGEARCWGDNTLGALGTGLLGDALLPTPVSNAPGTGPLTGVTQVTVGNEHGCARLQNGQARCWGRNDDGQVGDGTTTPPTRPRLVSDPAGTGPLGGITQIDVGDKSTCARLGNGQARCWGNSTEGQIGDGIAGPDRLRPRVVLNPAGTGPLGDVTQLQVARAHVCARLSNAQVRCWGDNGYTQLGDGTTAPIRLRPRPVLI